MNQANPGQVRIVVLISGSGTNLQALIDARDSGRLNADIVGVLSNKAGVKGLQRAENHNLATHVLDHTQYDSRESFDQAMMAWIDSLQPDLVILAGFMRILTTEFVEHYTGRLLNIHPSLLPKYKGLNTHARAIEAKDQEHGCSVHFVTPELDDGPIIAQARVTIDPNDTPDTLAAKVQRQEHHLYPACAQLFASGNLICTDNKILIDGEPLPETGIDLTNINP